MASNRKTNRYNSGIGNQGRIAQALDDLSAFEEFKRDILPKIRKMMTGGSSAEEIYAFAQAYAAGKAVSIAMSSPDERNALSAIKEILDRGVGKAAYRVEITTKYEKLTDDELNALLKSQEQDVADDELNTH